MSLQQAIDWGADALPMYTYCSNVLMTGTAAPDGGHVLLKRGFVDHFRNELVHSGVSWIYEAQDRIPALYPTSPHVIVWAQWNCAAGTPWRVILHEMYGVGTSSVSSGVCTPAQPASQVRVNRIATIQAAFGFNLQALARVLDVSRAQLYKWLDPEREIHLHEDSLNRLSQIDALASEWRKLSSRTLNTFAHERVLGAADIVSLMAEDELDVGAVVEALRHLAGRAPPRSVTEELERRGFRRRPTAQSFPSDA
jgi:hypothetical protein